MVECQLPKLDVAGSIPVARSIFLNEFLTSNLEVTQTLEASRERPQRIRLLADRRCQSQEVKTMQIVLPSNH